MKTDATVQSSLDLYVQCRLLALGGGDGVYPPPPYKPPIARHGKGLNGNLSFLSNLLTQLNGN